LIDFRASCEKNIYILLKQDVFCLFFVKKFGTSRDPDIWLQLSCFLCLGQPLFNGDQNQFLYRRSEISHLGIIWGRFCSFGRLHYMQYRP